MSRQRVVTGSDERGRPKAEWADPEPDTSRGYGFMEPALTGTVERRKATPEELAAARAREAEPSHLTTNNSRTLPPGALATPARLASMQADAERMQASRQRGAERHVEVVAARRTKPEPSPVIEEEDVELGDMTVKLLPTLALPCEPCAHRFVCSIRARIDKPDRWSIPAFAYDLEPGIHAGVRITLDCDHFLPEAGSPSRLVEPTPIGGGPAPVRRRRPGGGNQRDSERDERARHVLTVLDRHGGDTRAAGRELGMRGNIVGRIAQTARERAGAVPA